MKTTEPLGHDVAEESVVERQGFLIEPNEGQKELLEHRKRIRLPYKFVNHHTDTLKLSREL